MEGVNITISAVNCDNVEGPNITTTVSPEGITIIKVYFSLESALGNMHNQTACTQSTV